jgi:endonuclease/exonuclease/phosphatase family metal-dependent hydrolase
MRILNFNVQKENEDNAGKVSVISDLLTTHNPDVVGLQEVSPELYDLLFEVKGDYIISEKNLTAPFFNVILSRYDTPFTSGNFTETVNNRGYLTQVTPYGLFVNVHLDSWPVNAELRSRQLLEIQTLYPDAKVLFGTINFTEPEEVVPSPFVYCEKNSPEFFVYDSHKNVRALPYFRFDHSRVYVADPLITYDVTVLAQIKISNHCPLLADLTFP